MTAARRVRKMRRRQPPADAPHWTIWQTASRTARVVVSDDGSPARFATRQAAQIFASRRWNRGTFRVEQSGPAPADYCRRLAATRRGGPALLTERLNDLAARHGPRKDGAARQPTWTRWRELIADLEALPELPRQEGSP